MSTNGWEIKEKINTALEIYKDISRQIQFADTKAGLILAWHGASLGFLSKLVLDHLKGDKTDNLTVWLFFFGVIAALISIWFAFWVVYPRLKDTSCNKDCMFWAYHISCEGFECDLERFKRNISNPEKVLDCISRSTVAVANVLKEKYENLQKAFKFLAAALLFEGLTLFFLLIST